MKQNEANCKEWQLRSGYAVAIDYLSATAQILPPYKPRQMDGLTTTHPSEPLPFNEWAKYIRKETDKEYNISVNRLTKNKK